MNPRVDWINMIHTQISTLNTINVITLHTAHLSNVLDCRLPSTPQVRPQEVLLSTGYQTHLYTETRRVPGGQIIMSVDFMV